MSEHRRFEDLEIGESWTVDPVRFTEESIIEFAKRYDPQPFHLDAGAGAHHFDGLIASDWHTASACMRPFAGEIMPEIANISALGIDELRRVAPVRPGDELTVEVELIDAVQWSENRGRVTVHVAARDTRETVVHTRKDAVQVERKYRSHRADSSNLVDTSW